MPGWQRTLEEHCFSEDSEAVARLNFNSRFSGGVAGVGRLRPPPVGATAFARMAGGREDADTNRPTPSAHRSLHKSRRDDLLKPGAKPPDRDFAVDSSPSGATDTEFSIPFGRRSAALWTAQSFSGGFAPGFIRSPLRGCSFWMSCVSLARRKLRCREIRRNALASGSEFNRLSNSRTGRERVPAHAVSLILRRARDRYQCLRPRGAGWLGSGVLARP